MLDAVATIILAGMMFIPIINLVVGAVAGAKKEQDFYDSDLTFRITMKTLKGERVETQLDVATVSQHIGRPIFHAQHRPP